MDAIMHYWALDIGKSNTGTIYRYDTAKHSIKQDTIYNEDIGNLKSNYENKENLIVLVII